MSGRDDERLVEAIGKASEALEYVERARGELYTFHQLMGRADLLFGESADMLEACGQRADAERLRTEIVGRNVLDGRWTFQIVEEFDDLYYAPARDSVRALEADHLDGLRHVYESRLKDARRTTGRTAHERRPPAASTDEVDLDSDR